MISGVWRAWWMKTTERGQRADICGQLQLLITADLCRWLNSIKLMIELTGHTHGQIYQSRKNPRGGSAKTSRKLDINVCTKSLVNWCSKLFPPPTWSTTVPKPTLPFQPQQFVLFSENNPKSLAYHPVRWGCLWKAWKKILPDLLSLHHSPNTRHPSVPSSQALPRIQNAPRRHAIFQNSNQSRPS